MNFSDPRKQYLDFEPRYEVEDTIVTLEINHEFGDLTLTSLTGYYDSDYDARNDYDLTVSLNGASAGQLRLSASPCMNPLPSNPSPSGPTTRSRVAQK